MTAAPEGAAVFCIFREIKLFIWLVFKYNVYNYAVAAKKCSGKWERANAGA
jgi:hypothetical protein